MKALVFPFDYETARGRSQRDLADQYGVSTRTVRTWHKCSAPFNDLIQMREWIAARRQRLAHPRIGEDFIRINAAKHQVSISTIYSWLKKGAPFHNDSAMAEWKLVNARYISRRRMSDTKKREDRLYKKRSYSRKSITELSGSYVKSVLRDRSGLRSHHLPQTLIDLKRAELHLKRHLKQLEQHGKTKKHSRIARASA